MSGYGSPPNTPPPAAPRRSANLELPQLIGYAAGLLGILSFVWGFLSWFSTAHQGYAGYSVFGSGAGGAIGLSIAAGAVAAADVVGKKPASFVPAGLALGAFLVTLGLLIGRSPSGASVGVGVGLILTLITTFLQVIGLAFVWLLAIGRVHVPQRPAASGRRPAQQQDPYGAGAGMAGPGAPPPGQFPPQPPPGGYAPPAQPPPGGYAPPAQPQYGPPPSYGSQYAPPPPEPPMVGYGPPPATSSPGTPPGGGAPGPGSAPPPPPPPPGERPGTQWSPQTSYPGSRQEQGPPEPEDGGANP